MTTIPCKFEFLYQYQHNVIVPDQFARYVAYGGTNINVAQLSSNGLSQVKTQQVFASTIGAIEGSRMYKVNGKYYIFNDLPASAEYVLQASSPFGPYTQKLLESNIGSPVSGSGIPHQVGCYPSIGDYSNKNSRVALLIPPTVIGIIWLSSITIPVVALLF